MFTRRKFLVAALAALPLAAENLPRSQPDAVGLSPERLQRIDAAMEQHVAEKKVAGAVALVARNGRVAYLKAHGMSDVEANRPMQVDTMFRIASMTKPITSVAVMMLYEEGRFLLGDPVSKYLPEFKEMKVLPLENSSGEPVAAKRPITIFHLATHTSGLTYHWNKRIGGAYSKAGIDHGLLEDESTLADKIKVLATLPLVYQPGEKFEYGLSIDVLGRLVEVTSGMTLNEFFRKRIFEPLGMKDTHFFPPEADRPRIAAVYERKGDAPIRRVPEGRIAAEEGMGYSISYPYNGQKRYYSGGGGLVSTATDYAKFAQMLLNGGELDGARLLSPKTVDFMSHNRLEGIDPNTGFGLGFGMARNAGDVKELSSAGTYGWGGFFYTDFFIDPKEKLIGVFMSQMHPAEGVDLSNKFRVLAFQSIVK